nr:hypothetical protein [Streptomyces sp. SID10853]
MCSICVTAPLPRALEQQKTNLLISRFAAVHGGPEVGMGALAWLLIPLIAAVGAALWGRWATRRRTSGDGAELAGYARFREAMEKAGTGTDVL